MKTKKCSVCNKNKPENQFSKKDIVKACVDCKNKAIDRAKEFFNKPR